MWNTVSLGSGSPGDVVVGQAFWNAFRRASGFVMSAGAKSTLAATSLRSLRVGGRMSTIRILLGSSPRSNSWRMIQPPTKPACRLCLEGVKSGHV